MTMCQYPKGQKKPTKKGDHNLVGGSDEHLG
jgi:hypothetical protein